MSLGEHESYILLGVKITVIGGGLVGLGAAYAIQRMIDGAEVSVCEKETRLGAHQSTHNSGVLHAGLYYAPGSAKAVLAVRGIRLMTTFARGHNVPHEICGKVVVAVDDAEHTRLRALHQRGVANGLRDLTMLSATALRVGEPVVGAVAGLLVPEEGIIDYSRVVDALAAEIRSAGGVISTDTAVIGARAEAGGWILRTGGEERRADFVVNCGGLHSDRIARLFGARPTTRIVPFRGDYRVLRRPSLVKHLVYPVPDPAFPFLGVHFTRMIGGGVECGPTAVLVLNREGYKGSAPNVRDATEALTFGGLWRFMARHPGATWREWRRARSEPLLLASLRRLVPDVEASDLEAGPSGVRAQAMRRDGTLEQGFSFEPAPGALHVLSAPSPGATASLAIGEKIARRVAAQAGASLRSDRLEHLG